ncbi:O-antigen ligase [mine drainage metagenome]|uniref:O-antigen ligase n=1 Tax=mine drainage metagenome TaxID=410659 RepID=A0A1J5R2H7_9ZZZZ
MPTALPLLLLQSLCLLPIAAILTKATVLTALAAVLAALAARRLVFPGLAGAVWSGAVVLLCYVSTLWAIVPANSLERTTQVLGVFLLWQGLAAAAAGWSEEDRRRLSDLNLRGWLITVVLMLAGLALGLLLKSPDGVIEPLHTFRGELHRHFISKNGAVILSITSLPVLAHVLRQRNGRLQAGAMLVILLAALLASHSSSSLNGLVCGLLVWGLHRRFPRLINTLLAYGIPVVILTMPLLLYKVDPHFVAVHVPHFPPSFYHRLVIWQFSIQHITMHPFLGWGFDAARSIPHGTDAFHHCFPVPWSPLPYEWSGQYLPLHTHNAALQIWLELGALGAVLVALAMHSLVRHQVIGNREGKASLMAGLITAALAIAFEAFGVAQAWWLMLVAIAWAAVKALPRE